MNVLIGCEYSGRVRDAFTQRGHYAVSCDLLPSDVAHGVHYRGDIYDVLGLPWDLLIVFPPCTYLCSSGQHWVKRGRIEADGRARALHVEKAVKFATDLFDSPLVAHIPKRAMENPIGILSKRLRKPNQIIHPYMFGDDASKFTCLWLHGLEKLMPTKYIEPRIVDGKPRWANQTDSGQNKLPPSQDRWKLRSQTFMGIAQAMGQQWGVCK